MRRFYASLFASALCVLSFCEPFTLTILHTNDMHAHFEPTRVSGRMLGGYARQATLIKKFRASDENVVLLSGGDTFQGTIFFNTYQGLADLAFMNAVGYDAMAVGNHEFDKGPAALAEFAKGAAFPILAANLDVTNEPLLYNRIAMSATVGVGSEKIGVVGAVTDELPTISFIGPNVKMREMVASCQAAIDAMRQSGINKIVMVTHVGHREEVELAQKLSGVDVIVGGHSHTLLGQTGIEGISGGPYPAVVKNKDGDTALVVQAWNWGLVLGRIKVEFDEEGRVTGFRDANPVPVTEDIFEDQAIASMVRAFLVPIAAVKDRVIGSTVREVSRDAQTMANLVADAQLEATRHLGSVAAFINAGGVRAAIDAGEITYGEALMVQPFGNTLVVMEVTGRELALALGRSGGGTLHPSAGTSYTQSGGSASDIVIAGQPLDPNKTYKVTVNNFTAGGGDNHVELKAATGKRVESGIVDVDALLEFITKRSPLDLKPESRVRGGQFWLLAG